MSDIIVKSRDHVCVYATDGSMKKFYRDLLNLHITRGEIHEPQENYILSSRTLRLNRNNLEEYITNEEKREYLCPDTITRLYRLTIPLKNFTYKYSYMGDIVSLFGDSCINKYENENTIYSREVDIVRIIDGDAGFRYFKITGIGKRTFYVRDNSPVSIDKDVEVIIAPDNTFSLREY